MEKPSSTKSVIYHPPRAYYGSLPDKSIDPIGIDSEAYDDGKLMMICTSNEEVWTPDEWPLCILSHKYRNAVFVAYNLRYDNGAFLQHLPEANLDELRREETTIHNGTKYTIIANKFLKISRHKNTVTIYDLKQYYEGSLDSNAEKYLGTRKVEVETKSFSREYAMEHWQSLSVYCIQDSRLVRDLAKQLIAKLNSWGMGVTKLYSTAWISYQWFAAKCGHPSVGHFWHTDRRILDYAMASYSGGKFEVTKKGRGYLYEYDLVSAYPATISTLLDLHDSSVEWSTSYRRNSTYAFIRCKGVIPVSLPSPVAVKDNGVNTFPAGYIDKTITKIEYDYLIRNGADLSIDNAVWLYPKHDRYKYRDEINRIVEIKQSLKGKDEMGYHTAKIIMNSLYGKFIQLIEQSNGRWRASSSWNPIYGAIITAATRVRVSELQLKYPSIWAVHTDSVISDKPLPFPKSNVLGELSYELEGQGMVVGCGFYQIGEKNAIRGIPSKISIVSMAEQSGKTMNISSFQPLSWRQALLRTHDELQINRWIEQVKKIRPDMDTKRLWIHDWRDWHDAITRNVISAPKGHY